MALVVDYSQLYLTHDTLMKQQKEQAMPSTNKSRIDMEKERRMQMPAIKQYTHKIEDLDDDIDNTDNENANGKDNDENKMDGFKRMGRCRMALDALDRCGWKRSYFQRKFHEAFMAACARAFFKIDGPGAFQRNCQKVLEINGWNNLSQEILISTPRRFGKTISVSMFAAALLFSCSGIEMSIYSTCKRISQKLLRNVVKFLDLIYDDLGCERMKVLRVNCEEIQIQGPEGAADVRICSSYPSKVIMVVVFDIDSSSSSSGSGSSRRGSSSSWVEREHGYHGSGSRNEGPGFIFQETYIQGNPGMNPVYHHFLSPPSLNTTTTCFPPPPHDPHGKPGCCGFGCEMFKYAMTNCFFHSSTFTSCNFFFNMSGWKHCMTFS